MDGISGGERRYFRRRRRRTSAEGRPGTCAWSSPWIGCQGVGRGFSRSVDGRAAGRRSDAEHAQRPQQGLEESLHDALVCFVASGRSGRPIALPISRPRRRRTPIARLAPNRRRGRWHAALPSARVNRVRRYRIEKTENAPKGRSEIGRVRQGDRSCGERRRSRREHLGVFHQAVLLQALADGAVRDAQPFADLGLVAVELGQGEGQQLALEPVA